MVRNIIIAIVVILLALLLLYPLAHAQDGHAVYHENYYNGWVNKLDKGCCNNLDCGKLADSDERTDRGILEVRIMGEWCPIQPYHYLKKGNVPDASVSHVCIQKSPAPFTSPCARLLCYQPKPGA